MNRFHLIGYALAALLAACCAPAARAGVTLAIDSRIIASDPAAPLTAEAEVYVSSVTGGPYFLAGYNARVDSSSILAPLTGVQPASIHAPLFAASLPSLTDETDSDTLFVSDLLFSGQVPLTSGAGLFAITLNVPAGAMGTFTLSLNSNEVFLFDGNANPVPVDAFVNGLMTVNPVPEPATAASLLGGGLLLLARRRRA